MKIKFCYLIVIAMICVSGGLGCRPSEDPLAQNSALPSDPNELYPVSAAHEILGQWRFVYFKKYYHLEGQLPAPPVFDAVDLTEPDIIIMKSRLNGREEKGSFVVTFGLLKYEFRPGGSPQPVTQKSACFLANHGKAMILTTETAELVFFRADRIFENSIHGTWRTQENGVIKTMILSEDGEYRMAESAAAGHYRLWPSRFGNAMTVIYQQPPYGAFMAIFLYQLDRDVLTLVPIENLQVISAKAKTWTRQ